ncbi:hypothetical protein UO65_5939 [Actinokineospora spheciospongiae]|uniref:Uncharacterized protein n=1 Tax=Actinokineospora spheciospongiae TaxID=909613 RepID=W7IPV3_9PSEU|nr:hypothetical protein [Actinokineospora spheciospongiae]EWC58762.1 hypothetical protein UO65_5939 [Actinokineospora spheciospongiae]PWW63449.1 hypothetical protein DFQ13_104441 [Actinokineospora spheciospongiae]
MFKWRKERPELTDSLRVEADRRRAPAPPLPSRSPAAPPGPGLAAFLADLRPHEPVTFDSPTAKARHDAVVRLAPHPLTAELENTARELVGVTLRAYKEKRAGHEGNAVTEVRAIGARLGAQGGGFLMVLVAHRAQYLLDPDWRAARAGALRRLREQSGGEMAAVLTSGGPLVAVIEGCWADICGWQR